MRRTFTLLGIAAAAILLIGCASPHNNGQVTATAFTVTYDANGADSGTAPADQTKVEGTDLMLAENTGGLARDGFTFVGWNTAADATGTAYGEGATYSEDADLTLYAAWAFDLVKILASDIAGADNFGYSVAVDGDYAIVGSRYDDDNGTNSGGAYIFHRTGPNSWDAGTKIIAPDGADSDQFGTSVAISGGYAIVGAPIDDIDVDGDTTEESGVGSAYIFQRTGTNSWDTGTKIVASDGAAIDRFGKSVSIDGDYAIVGSRLSDIDVDGDTTAEQDVGAAYIFRRTGTNSWVEDAQLLASDGEADDEFGLSVAIEGEYAIVGAPLNDDNATNAGSAYIFRRTGTSTWDTGIKVVATDPGGDRFGESVAISGDYAIVGAYLNDDAGLNSGSAYIFHRSGTGNSWDTGTKIVASDAASIDVFGHSVGISGDYAIVGAYGDDHVDDGDSMDNDYDGSAYIFHRTGTNSWTEETQITASDAESDDYFGYSVAIDGDYAIAGAWRNDDSGSDTGSAYIRIIAR
ncbi:MAG: hypothetical protein GVY29_10240 [Spirochaetes bacterium]|jgi:uncharacterized repeat protein (TIGR02543 family)|nr:hypothetical protein [Spirochaetota bacterium]